MNPCKDCVVRPCCSEDCKDFEKFSEFWSGTLSFISILIAGSITVLFLYWSADKSSIRTISWILMASVNVIFLNTKVNEKIGDFVCIIFAPLIFCALIQIYIYAAIFNKLVRKRV